LIGVVSKQADEIEECDMNLNQGTGPGRGTCRGVDILVVDDEPSVRHAIKSLLEFSGHKVGEVEGGEAALALLGRRSFDVVITDFSMPGMRGDQLVARIRKQLPHQRIIMITALVEDYLTYSQYPGSVNALIAKPFSFQELTETLERVLAGESVATAAC
jgi:CheY-like chemotaxis protein